MTLRNSRYSHIVPSGVRCRCGFVVWCSFIAPFISMLLDLEVTLSNFILIYDSNKATIMTKDRIKSNFLAQCCLPRWRCKLRSVEPHVVGVLCGVLLCKSVVKYWMIVQRLWQGQNSETPASNAFQESAEHILRSVTSWQIIDCSCCLSLMLDLQWSLSYEAPFLHGCVLMYQVIFLTV